MCHDRSRSFAHAQYMDELNATIDSEGVWHKVLQLCANIEKRRKIAFECAKGWADEVEQKNTVCCQLASRAPDKALKRIPLVEVTISKVCVWNEPSTFFFGDFWHATGLRRNGQQWASLWSIAVAHCRHRYLMTITKGVKLSMGQQNNWMNGTPNAGWHSASFIEYSSVH